MHLHHPNAVLFIPDASDEPEALARTTHLGIGAHQDDLEIMAASGILECYNKTDAWFSGVVVTDGRGAPRGAAYAGLSPEDYVLCRDQEQCDAARLGQYGAQLLLAYPSAALKTQQADIVHDLVTILEATRPAVVYTHNLADKHQTHVAVALRVIEAARACAPEARPKKLYGCEVWRDLDWMPDSAKVLLDTSGNENLLQRLIGCFRSQLAVKRYDLAASGRRHANATYHESHEQDQHSGLIYAMDLTPLLAEPAMCSSEYTLALINQFASEVANAMERAKD